MRQALVKLLLLAGALLAVAGIWYISRHSLTASSCATQSGAFSATVTRLLEAFESELVYIKQNPDAPDLADSINHLRSLRQESARVPLPGCAVSLLQSLNSYLDMSITASMLLEHDSDRDTINQTFDAADVAKQRFYREWKAFEGG